MTGRIIPTAKVLWARYFILKDEKIQSVIEKRHEVKGIGRFFDSCVDKNGGVVIVAFDSMDYCNLLPGSLRRN